MAKKRTPSDWKIDHATWSFSSDKYNAPVLKLDFTQPADGDTSHIRTDYLGSLRFLEGKHFHTDPKNGNHFDYQPLRDGNEVITLKGIGNIRHVTQLLRKRLNAEKEAGLSSNPVIAEHLDVIPLRLSGSGKNLPDDKFMVRQPNKEEISPAAIAEKPFELDGNPPVSKRGLKQINPDVISTPLQESVKKAVVKPVEPDLFGQQGAQTPAAASHVERLEQQRATATLPSLQMPDQKFDSPEAEAKVRESLARREEYRRRRLAIKEIF